MPAKRLRPQLDDAGVEIFRTKRLAVRAWQASDLPSLHRILGDAQTMAHWPEPYDMDGSKAWLTRSIEAMAAHGHARWCCQRLADGQVIGDVGIVRMPLDEQWVNDLGYIIHRDYWRLGYAYEAAAGAVAWARAQGLDRLAANMAKDNLPSVAVAKKLGMECVREFVNPRNRDKPTYWFELKL